MATHKSALKRARQNVKRRDRNRQLRSGFRTEIKKFRSMIDEKKLDDAQGYLATIHKVIDRACTKGVLPKNTASRYKSNLTVSLNKAVGAQA